MENRKVTVSQQMYKRLVVGALIVAAVTCSFEIMKPSIQKALNDYVRNHVSGLGDYRDSDGQWHHPDGSLLK